MGVTGVLDPVVFQGPAPTDNVLMPTPGAVVTRAIRDEVRPLLVASGFEDFTPRKAWRRQDGFVEVVDFQAVGTHAAHGVGCSSHSFAVYIGVQYPHWSPLIAGGESNRPDYHACTFQYVLPKSVVQLDAFRPYGSRPGTERLDTWAVRDDASDADTLVKDAARSIEKSGLAWLAQARNPDLMYRALLGGLPSYRSGTPGMLSIGVIGSPLWLSVVQHLGSILGRDVDADIAAIPDGGRTRD